MCALVLEVRCGRGGGRRDEGVDEGQPLGVRLGWGRVSVQGSY